MPSPCSLLLVDDEPEILESLRRALRDKPFEAEELDPLLDRAQATVHA